jgi:DNA end-binding protein Ku
MRQKWEPEAFKDTYRDDLLNRIEQKVQAGQTKTLTPAAAKASELRTAEVVDLSELLRRSLEKRGGKTGTTKRRANGDGAARAAAEPATPPSRARKAPASASTGASTATKRRRSA